jgi:hypothetical protein
MTTSYRDRHGPRLLISLLILYVRSGLASRGRLGEVILVVTLFGTLVAAVLELSEKKVLRWPAIILAGCSMPLILIAIFYPARSIWIVSWSFLGAFFGFFAVAIFSYLGQPGSITSDPIYASASLYLVFAVFYFAIFNLVEVVHSGSFVEAGLPAAAGILRHSLLYFSLVTLTTLGYGDVVPIARIARTLAALEAATGVLYISITVARLVAGYQVRTGNESDSRPAQK